MTLAEELSRHTNFAAAELSQPLSKGRVRCVACGHRCSIFPGMPGVCKVRFNDGGTLRVPYGYVNGIACDPIEKKPFFHALPGSTALSFGMLGCDMHCPYCQNWVSSQALRDEHSTLHMRPVSPQEIVEAAHLHGADSVVSTYNEPLITAEWAVDVFRQARNAGLVTGFVSNGNATPEVLAWLRPWLDLYKVDLKGFDDAKYRQLGARLQPILDSIQLIHEMGFWLEVVTLVVPGFNDSPRELNEIARFLAGVSPDIPWHVSAFHPDYKMTGPPSTPLATLRLAVELGHAAGLRYVYAGNLGRFHSELESTFCPQCGEILIERMGFTVAENRIGEDGKCFRCGATIPGVWARTAAKDLAEGGTR